MGEVLKAFLAGKPANTKRAYKAHLNKFSEFLSVDLGSPDFKEAALEFTPARGMLFFEWLTGQGVKGQTINAYLRTVRVFFEYLRDAGLIERNPIGRHLKASKEPVSQAGLIPDRLVLKLLKLPGLDEKGLQQRALLALMFYTGLRIGEIIKLKWSQVSWEEKELQSVPTKGGKSRDILLHQIPYQALKRLSIKRFESPYGGAGFVFKSPRTNKHVDYKTAYRAVKRLFKEVGLDEGYSPHSARATAITKLLDQGLSHREVQAFSGHESITMVERYDRKRKNLSFPLDNLVYIKK